MARVKCRACGWSGDADDAYACASPHHDMRCRNCSSTNMDTSEVESAFAARGEVYSYGSDNTFTGYPVHADSVLAEHNARQMTGPTPRCTAMRMRCAQGHEVRVALSTVWTIIPRTCEVCGEPLVDQCGEWEGG